MFFKYAFFLIGILSVSACAIMNPERYQACQLMAHEIGKEESWVEECVLNDSQYNTGLYQVAEKVSPDELCAADQDALDISQKNIFSDVAKKRKIDCKPYKIARAKEVLNSIPVSDLCVLWNNGSTDSTTTEVIRAKVSEQKIDCPSMLAVAAQQQQALAQQQQAMALYQQTLLQQQIQASNQATRSVMDTYRDNNTQRALSLLRTTTTTNCRTDYMGGFNCTTR